MVTFLSIYDAWFDEYDETVRRVRGASIICTAIGTLLIKIVVTWVKLSGYSSEPDEVQSNRFLGAIATFSGVMIDIVQGLSFLLLVESRDDNKDLIMAATILSCAEEVIDVLAKCCIMPSQYFRWIVCVILTENILAIVAAANITEVAINKDQQIFWSWAIVVYVFVPIMYLCCACCWS